MSQRKEKVESNNHGIPESVRQKVNEKLRARTRPSWIVVLVLLLAGSLAVAPIASQSQVGVINPGRALSTMSLVSVGNTMTKMTSLSNSSESSASTGSSNETIGSGQILAQGRLLLSGATLNSPLLGNCNITPNKDAVQCEALAYAGDRGSIELNVTNSGNTATVALISIESSQALLWGISSPSTRNLGNNQFAFTIDPQNSSLLTLIVQINGTAYSGSYQFSFSLSPLN